MMSDNQRYHDMKFTYSEYENILITLREKGFKFVGYGMDKDVDNCHDDAKNYQKTVILRHDVDVSLEKALRFAVLENKLGGVKSTFFILVASDFYNVMSYKSIRMIRQIMNLGHDIGLHFDESRYFYDMQDPYRHNADEKTEWNITDLKRYISAEKSLLEQITGKEVSVVSMHRPSRSTLEQDIEIPDMVNSYGKKYFLDIKYVSDSYHRWREDIYDVIDTFTRIQLLTHPFWYSDTSISRSEAFYNLINMSGDRTRKMIEDNVLPRGVTFEQSIDEDTNSEG